MAWTDYQVRFQVPAYIERDRDTELVLSVYDDGALAAPSSGEVSVFNASNEAVVNAQSVTITASRATYTISAATVSGESYGAGWRVEWSLTMPDGNTHLFRQSGALVRARLYPVITDADIERRHYGISDHLASGQADLEDYIEEAWVGVQSRLVEMGRRPYLVLSPEALRNVHLYETLQIICTDFAGDGDPSNKWTMLGERYRIEAEQAWGRVNFEYDDDDDGRTDGAKRHGGLTSIWLGSVRNRGGLL